jgi:hypothetical protein
VGEGGFGVVGKAGKTVMDHGSECKSSGVGGASGAGGVIQYERSALNFSYDWVGRLGFWSWKR